MFFMLKKKKYVSIHNSNRKKLVFLMIPDGEEWHYLAVKELSSLLRGITSKNNGDFYCLKCFNSFRTKNKLESHKKVSENKNFLEQKTNLSLMKNYVKIKIFVI